MPRGVLKGMHLLVVEDNAVNLEIAVEMLSGLMGAEVDTARDGEEGCSRFLEAPEHTYDVILMDLQMPVLGGLDAARRIRRSSHPQAAAIPIIALTANAFEEDRRETLEAGMNGFVPKPIDFTILAKEIARVRREGRCLRLLLAEDNELNPVEQNPDADGILVRLPSAFVSPVLPQPYEDGRPHTGRQ